MWRGCGRECRSAVRARASHASGLAKRKASHSWTARKRYSFAVDKLATLRMSMDYLDPMGRKALHAQRAGTVHWIHGRFGMIVPSQPECFHVEEMTIMTSRAASNEYRYEKLTWPEINDAVELGKVCVLAVQRGRAARAAPAARCRRDLPDRDRSRGRPDHPREDAAAAHLLLRLHRPRDGFSRDDQHPLRAFHRRRARHHQEPGLSRVQEDHPA